MMSDSIRSLKDLLAQVSARRILDVQMDEDMGIDERLAFPFLALVGQNEMKLALLLSLINPNIGGVLLLGPRGTGKTTAVRSLVDLLPKVDRSRCPYGCLPEDVETGGIEAICPQCAERHAHGEPLTYLDRVRLIDLPLNARLEDVVGGIDTRAAMHDRIRLKRGLLAQADRNLLYVDEVNLLEDDIVDSILDAAAQGSYTVYRGPISATYRSRFTLIGSMNPEEGQLRPQIMDRFGLRAIVRGLSNPEDRLEAYRRSLAFKNHPRAMIQTYADATQYARIELDLAREKLPHVILTQNAERYGLELVQTMGIESLRAEITLFEAARAHATADGREKATADDVRITAPLALRLRRSPFMVEYFNHQAQEEDELTNALDATLPGLEEPSEGE